MTEGERKAQAGRGPLFPLPRDFQLHVSGDAWTIDVERAWTWPQGSLPEFKTSCMSVTGNNCRLR